MQHRRFSFEKSAEKILMIDSEKLARNMSFGQLFGDCRACREVWKELC